MSISFNLGANLKLGTSQKLTPQMQQAIRLLQMSSIELEQEVQIQLDQNPMLEREDNNDDLLDHLDANNNLDSLSDYNSDNIHDTDTIGNDISSSDSLVDDTFDKLSSASFDDNAVDTNWDNVYTSSPKSLSTNSYDGNEIDGYFGNTITTIQDHIRWQLNFKHLSNVDMVIADYLVDSMDESGFIQISLEELHSSLSTIASFYQWDDSIDFNEIKAVLKIIQSCEPLGVGARNLSECLLLQLAKVDENTPYLEEAEQILAHTEYLLSNNINTLLTETGLSLEDIQPALSLIRTLNPSPGMAYNDSQATYGNAPESYDIPDVLVSVVTANNKLHQTAGNEISAPIETLDTSVHQTDGMQSPDVSTDVSTDNEEDNNHPVWKVELNPDTLPKLRINQEYACLVKRGDDSPDNVYLKDNLNDAKVFIRSIEERNYNLLKVARCIIERQQQFLIEGATAMQPLILKDIAEAVDLHESTVSRLTTSKTILTPQGLFSLKYFFSSSVSGSQGDVSSTAICAMISELISNENPKKPLSDNAITKHLQENGIDIARRTVAKYREQLKIGSSSQRKQKY